jgi:photosystem II stability/assembly factor-like uncharacterized protein
LTRLMGWAVRVSVGLCLSLAFLALPMRAVTWFPLGPYGGDARSFAADSQDSKHLFLGTATGWVYESRDGGGTWNRLSQIMRRNDLVIDHILTDPRATQMVIVGVWCVDRPDGGLFISSDGGKSWVDEPDMHGQSIRALTRSASSPDTLIAGTLQGVFRSVDNGKHWKPISPAGSMEIHEIESVAVDPKNPEIIYAGTWHLPWKTVDGGAHWENIKHGIIEDSDVFSIIIDPKQTNIVYASACSGIYKSTNAGAEFKGGVSLNKLQGIPSSARRTRKLMQDPQHLQTVYAGTTEGLYRTLDGGVQWDKLTGSDVIVNDVYVDPNDSAHVLLATDRGGVLSSHDFAASFRASNAGFSARQVTAYAADPRNPALVYVGVVNDKETGGVFQSNDGGVHWQQQSAGLGGRDVFSLASTSNRTLLAGTTHGIFRLQDGLWTDSSALQAASPEHKGPRARGQVVHATAEAARLDAVVYSLVPDGYTTYAGTSQGLLRSASDGMSWTPVHALGIVEARFVANERSMLLVADLKRIVLSLDGGEKWVPIAMPVGLTQVSAVAVDGHGGMWVGGREGIFLSQDKGMSWKPLHDLSINQVDSIYFDPIGDRILLTTSTSPVVFSVKLPDLKVRYWDTGWKLRFARPVGDYILGATLFDGIVVQPKMVDSGVADANASQGKEAK